MLRADVMAMQNRQTDLRKEYNSVLSEIMLTRSLKEELGKHRMDLNIISRLVQTIQYISDMGFDVNQIISRVSTIEARIILYMCKHLISSGLEHRCMLSNLLLHARTQLNTCL
jgi:hypothetical protein